MRLREQREATHARALPDQVRDVDRRLAPCRVSQRGQDAAEGKRGGRVTRQGTAHAVDDDIHPAASREASDAISETLRREIDDIVEAQGSCLLGFGRRDRRRPCPRPRAGDSRSGGQQRTLQAGRRAGARRWTSRTVRYNISRALSTSRTWSPCGLRALRLAGARVWLQQRVQPAAQGQHFRVGGGEPRADPFGALEEGQWWLPSPAYRDAAHQAAGVDEAHVLEEPAGRRGAGGARWGAPRRPAWSPRPAPAGA